MLKAKPVISAAYAIFAPLSATSFAIAMLAACPHIDEKSIEFAAELAEDAASRWDLPRFSCFATAAAPGWTVGQILTIDNFAAQFSLAQLHEWATQVFSKASDAYKDNSGASNFRALKTAMLVYQQAMQVQDMAVVQSNLVGGASLGDAVCRAACGFTLNEVSNF